MYVNCNVRKLQSAHIEVSSLHYTLIHYYNNCDWKNDNNNLLIKRTFDATAYSFDSIYNSRFGFCFLYLFLFLHHGGLLPSLNGFSSSWKLNDVENGTYGYYIIHFMRWLRMHLSNLSFFANIQTCMYRRVSVAHHFIFSSLFFYMFLVCH